jgi:hypothetical protein
MQSAIVKFNFTENAIRHCINALEYEIDRLQKVHDEVGEDWPAWFDANDKSIYQCMLDWFKPIKPGEDVETNVISKPFGFMMELIEQYIKSETPTLTDSEREELNKFLEKYKNAIEENT